MPASGATSASRSPARSVNSAIAGTVCPVVEPRRFVPRFQYELLGCGVSGHEIVGSDAARLRPQDAVFAREIDGWRWYRCLRCDSWLAMPPPAAPTREVPPARE